MSEIHMKKQYGGLYICQAEWYKIIKIPIEDRHKKKIKFEKEFWI